MPSIAPPSAVGPVAATAALLPIGGAGDQSAADRASLDLPAGSSSDGSFTPSNFADALKHHMSDATTEDGRRAESKAKTDKAQDDQTPTADSQAGAMALARLQASAAPAEQGTLALAAQGASPVSGLAASNPDVPLTKGLPPASPDTAAAPNPATAENFAAIAKAGKAPGPTQQAATLSATAGQPPANAPQNADVPLPAAPTALPTSLPVSAQPAPSLPPQQITGTQALSPSDKLASSPAPQNFTTAATGAQPLLSSKPVSSDPALPNSTAAVSLPDSGTARSATMPDLSATVAARAPIPLAGATSQAAAASGAPTATGTPAVSAIPTALGTPATPTAPQPAAAQAALASTANAPLQGATATLSTPALDRTVAPASAPPRRPTAAQIDASAASAASELHEPPLTTLATPVAAPSSSEQARSDSLLSTLTLPAESGQALADASQTAFATAATLAASHGMATRQDSPVTPVTVHTPFGAPSWSEEIGKNLVWQAGQEQHKAELVLTPPHLGRIEISITIKNDEANASFVSANPAVRDALEQAMPRLREMLANAGITLGQANVGADSSAGGSNYEGNSGYSGRRGSSKLDLGAITSTPVTSRQGNGLVDTFA